MKWKRITLDGMKWWVPCRKSDPLYNQCVDRAD